MVVKSRASCCAKLVNLTPRIKTTTRILDLWLIFLKHNFTGYISAKFQNNPGLGLGENK